MSTPAKRTAPPGVVVRDSQGGRMLVRRDRSLDKTVNDATKRTIEVYHEALAKLAKH